MAPAFRIEKLHVAESHRRRRIALMAPDRKHRHRGPRKRVYLDRENYPTFFLAALRWSHVRSDRYLLASSFDQSPCASMKLHAEKCRSQVELKQQAFAALTRLQKPILSEPQA